MTDAPSDAVSLDLLRRIADSLERLAPRPTPVSDIAAADAFVWHADP